MSLPEPIGEAALAFFQKLLGPVGEAGEILSDKIRFYRWRSSLKTIQRAKEIAQENGLSTNEVPLKFLIPFMEKSSLEEEGSDLIERWAMLLAQSSNNNSKAKVTFIEVLSRLSSEEVQILENMVSEDFVKNVLSGLAGWEGNLTLPAELGTFATGAKLALFQEASSNIDKLSTDNELDDDWYEKTRDSLYAFSMMNRVGYIIEMLTFDFYDQIVGHAGIYSANVDALTKGTSYDVLISCGLLSRYQANFPKPLGEVSLTALFPTALALEFVMACRGDSLRSAQARG